jgi:hypothetical protein
VLADGTVIRKGDPVLEFHYWNERIPPMGPQGPDVAWGVQYYRRLRRSLNDLAEYARDSPDCRDIVAVYCEPSYAASVGWNKYEKFISDFGFEFFHYPATATHKNLVNLFTHLYVWLLIWASNPASLRGRPLSTAERCTIWQSREGLIRRHGSRKELREVALARERRPGEGGATVEESASYDAGDSAAVSSSGPLNLSS